MGKYWAPRVEVNASLTETEAIEGLRAGLATSVRSKLVADVPLGVFLSGGIDSSAVVAFMSGQGAPVRTYSVGFGTEINELPYARRVAEKFGTQHTEIIVDSRLSDEVYRATAYYDEPFADTSSVPTYVISREARKHVKVVLTGDGGDELFAGYDRYIPQKYHSKSPFLGRAARAVDTVSLKACGQTLLDAWYPFSSGEAAYREWMAATTYFRPEQIRAMMKQEVQPELQFSPQAGFLHIAAADPLSGAFQHDVNFYLPDDLLKKVDMASMAHGLECRAPFLDHKLVEFALSIPPQLKLRNNISKYLLRKAMEPDLPEGIAWRAKQGFGAPVASWLNGDLKALVDDTLGASARIAEVLDRSTVRALVQSLREDVGRADWRLPIQVWSILMLELWLQSYGPSG
jgi:asparagine synthase (glutamine-hydrolysing)